MIQTSHSRFRLASRSATQPLLLRVKTMRLPSGEKRGNQSTESPRVRGRTSLPSVFIKKSLWFPARELDQTMVPLALAPRAFIAARSASEGTSSLPSEGRPPSVAQAHDSRHRHGSTRLIGSSSSGG
jgi:hypothetical protein